VNEIEWLRRDNQSEMQILPREPRKSEGLAGKCGEDGRQNSQVTRYTTYGEACNLLRPRSHTYSYNAFKARCRHPQIQLWIQLAVLGDHAGLVTHQRTPACYNASLMSTQVDDGKNGDVMTTWSTVIDNAMSMERWQKAGRPNFLLNQHLNLAYLLSGFRDWLRRRAKST
jgi:hypothetical protein